MKHLRKNNGITLISLVITIIILLILAGITIATLTGENGILKKATKAKQSTIIQTYEEEIKLELLDEQTQRKIQENTEIFIVSLKDRLEKKDWIKEIIMYDENFVDQEDKTKNTNLIINTVDNYQIIINVDNEKLLATIKENIELSGEMITIKYNANVGDVEINSQKLNKGAILSFVENTYTRMGYSFDSWCEDKSGNGKRYFPGDKIIITEEKTFYAIWNTKTEDSILKGVEKVKESGNQTVKVNGKSYNMHIYYYNGNQIWNENKTFGNSNDVGTSSANAKNMVVVKVDGDLEIANNVTIQPYHNNYGGPKGFLIYCTGTLTNNGKITNNYGAKASGEDVYLWKNTSGNYEFIPASGAVGGAALNSGGKEKTGFTGKQGANANTSTRLSGSGVKRATAGGGRWWIRHSKCSVRTNRF